MSISQPLCFCYNIMYKHICISPNVGTSGYLSADERLQERRNLLDFLQVVHIPQGFCESGAAIVTNAVMVQAGNNIPRKMDIKLVLFNITSWVRGKLQSHTYISLFRDGMSQSASTSLGMAAPLSFMWPRLKDEITQEQLTTHGQSREHSEPRRAEQGWKTSGSVF